MNILQVGCNPQLFSTKMNKKKFKKISNNY